MCSNFMVKLMVKQTSTAVGAAAVLLVCTKAMYTQEQIRLQHASQVSIPCYAPYGPGRHIM